MFFIGKVLPLDELKALCPAAGGKAALKGEQGQGGVYVRGEMILPLNSLLEQCVRC